MTITKTKSFDNGTIDNNDDNKNDNDDDDIHNL